MRVAYMEHVLQPPTVGSKSGDHGMDKRTKQMGACAGLRSMSLMFNLKPGIDELLLPVVDKGISITGRTHSRNYRKGN